MDRSPLPEGTKITAVPLTDFSRVLDVLESAFPDLSRAFFSSLILSDPAYRPEYGLAVQDRKRVLSYVRIFARTLILNGKKIPFGGIGCVATHPDFRGRGYASALLRYAEIVMRNAGMAASLLFTHINSFYERLGWSTIRQTEQDIPVFPLIRSPYRSEWIRAPRESDFPVLQKIHSRMADRLGGGILRNEAYWKTRVLWLTHFSTLVLEKDQIIGYFYYAQYDLKKPVLTISEYGYLEEGDGTAERLLRCMAHKAKELGCETLRGFFQQDLCLSEYCQRQSWTLTPIDFQYLMWNDFSAQSRVDSLQNQADRPHLICWTTDAF